MIALEQCADGVVIPLRVRASARRTSLGGVHDGAIRVDVTSAPEKGKANRAVIEVLSKALCVAKSRISIVSGETSVRKRLLVSGMTLLDVQRTLPALVGSQPGWRDEGT